MVGGKTQLQISFCSSSLFRSLLLFRSPLLFRPRLFLRPPLLFWPLLPFLFFLLSTLLQCNIKIRGDFGWFIQKDGFGEATDSSLKGPKLFRFQRKEVLFYDSETIWWIYRIKEGFYTKEGFVAALYRDDLAPQPIERDLRQVSLHPGNRYDYIRQYWPPLQSGRYLLLIAYNSEPVDKIQFWVAPSQRPALPIIWRDREDWEEEGWEEDWEESWEED